MEVPWRHSFLWSIPLLHHATLLGLLHGLKVDLWFHMDLHILHGHLMPHCCLHQRQFQLQHQKHIPSLASFTLVFTKFFYFTYSHSILLYCNYFCQITFSFLNISSQRYYCVSDLSLASGESVLEPGGTGAATHGRNFCVVVHFLVSQFHTGI